MTFVLKVPFDMTQVMTCTSLQADMKPHSSPASLLTHHNLSHIPKECDFKVHASSFPETNTIKCHVSVCILMPTFCNSPLLYYRKQPWRCHDPFMDASK